MAKTDMVAKTEVQIRRTPSDIRSLSLKEMTREEFDAKWPGDWRRQNLEKGFLQ